MLTVVGAISGNCDIGNLVIARMPTKTIMTDMTMANTGLRMNLLNIVFCRVGGPIFRMADYSAYRPKFGMTESGFTNV